MMSYSNRFFFGQKSQKWFVLVGNLLKLLQSYQPLWYELVSHRLFKRCEKNASRRIGTLHSQKQKKDATGLLILIDLFYGRKSQKWFVLVGNLLKLLTKF